MPELDYVTGVSSLCGYGRREETQEDSKRRREKESITEQEAARQ